MRRAAVVLCVLAILIGSAAQPAFAAPEFSASKYDNALEKIWPFVQTKQAAYLQANGVYWQGLSTHSTTPAALTIPDRWYSHPHDQAATWDHTKIIERTAIPYLLYIDVYSGPSGTGYVFCAQAVDGGSTWRRCWQYGPEIYREHGWMVVE